MSDDAYTGFDTPTQRYLDEVARCGIGGPTSLFWAGVGVAVMGGVAGGVWGMVLMMMSARPDPLVWLYTLSIWPDEYVQAALWFVGYGGLAAWLMYRARRDPIRPATQRAALGVLSRLEPYDVGDSALVMGNFLAEDAPDVNDYLTVVSEFPPCGTYVQCTTYHGELQVSVTVYGYLGGIEGPLPGALLVVKRDTKPWFELTSRPSETPGLEPEEAWRLGLDEVIARFERELDARLPSDAPRARVRMVRGGAEAAPETPKPRAWTLRGTKRPIAYPKPPDARTLVAERVRWALGVAGVTALWAVALWWAFDVALDPDTTRETRAWMGVVTLGIAPVIWAGVVALYKLLPGKTIAALDQGRSANPEARLELDEAGHLTLASGDGAPATVDLTRPFVVRLHRENEVWMHVVIAQGIQRLTMSTPCAGFAGERGPSALEVEAPVLNERGLRELWSALVHYSALSEGDRGDLSQWRPEGLPSKHA